MSGQETRRHPEDTFLPLLPFGPDGIRRAPPRRTHPDGGEDTRCAGGCQRYFLSRCNPITIRKKFPQTPAGDLVYGKEFVCPVINCCFSTPVSWADGCIGKIDGRRLSADFWITLTETLHGVTIDQPGDRRHVAIPRPDGLVAMTVETGAFCQCARLRAIPFWLGCDGWVIASPGQLVETKIASLCYTD